MYHECAVLFVGVLARLTNVSVPDIRRNIIILINLKEKLIFHKLCAELEKFHRNIYSFYREGSINEKKNYRANLFRS